MKITIQKYNEYKADLVFYYDRLEIVQGNPVKEQFWLDKIQQVEKILELAVIR